MEVVNVKNRNPEILDYLSEDDKKAYDTHPFKVLSLPHLIEY